MFVPLSRCKAFVPHQDCFSKDLNLIKVQSGFGSKLPYADLELIFTEPLVPNPFLRLKEFSRKVDFPAPIGQYSISNCLWLNFKLTSSKSVRLPNLRERLSLLEIIIEFLIFI